jgi:hypothetical protein
MLGPELIKWLENPAWVKIKGDEIIFADDMPPEAKESFEKWKEHKIAQKKRWAEEDKAST